MKKTRRSRGVPASQDVDDSTPTSFPLANRINDVTGPSITSVRVVTPEATTNYEGPTSIPETTSKTL